MYRILEEEHYEKSDHSGITEPLIDKSHNAEVTMLYDQAQMDWVIQTLDFEIYVQDPSKWTKQQKIKLEQVNEGTWDSENPTGIT